MQLRERELAIESQSSAFSLRVWKEQLFLQKRICSCITLSVSSFLLLSSYNTSSHWLPITSIWYLILALAAGRVMIAAFYTMSEQLLSCGSLECQHLLPGSQLKSPSALPYMISRGGSLDNVWQQYFPLLKPPGSNVLTVFTCFKKQFPHPVPSVLLLVSVLPLLL